MEISLRVIKFVMDDLNNGTAHPAGYHFNLLFGDTKYQRLSSVEAAIDLQSKGAIALLGEWSSSNTIPIALTSTSFNSLLCSGSATSDELSSVVDYPLFIRTISSDSYQGVVMARIARNFNWMSVNMFTVGDDAYAVSLAKAFQTTAATLNITIARTYTVQTLWALDDFHGVVTQLADSPSRVSVIFAQPDQAYQIPLLARRNGFGPDWVWFGCEALSLMDTPFLEAHGLTPAELAYYEGFLLAWPAELAPGSPRYESVVAKWQRVYNDTVIKETAYALFMGSCLDVLVNTFIDLVRRVGLAPVVNRTHKLDLADFVVNRDSVSGFIDFAANGDRNGKFQVLNFQNSAYVPVYSVRNGTFSTLAPVKFADGSSVIPDWRPKYVEILPDERSAGVIIVSTLTGLVIAAVVVAWVAIVVNRKSKRVRHLGLPFTAVLCIGIVMCLSASFLMAGRPTPLKCEAQYWVMILGYSLTLSSLWIRSYRLWKIFDRVLTKSTAVRTRPLLFRMLALPVLQIILLIIHSATSPLQAAPLISGSTIQYQCKASSAGGTALLYVAAGIDGLLLVLLAYLSFKIRRIHSSYQDTMWIAYLMHHLLIAACIAIPVIVLFSTATIVTYYVRAVAVIYTNVAIFSSMVARHNFALPDRANQDPNAAMLETLDGAGGPGSGGGQETLSAGGSTAQRNVLSGVYPVKSTTGFLRRWQNRDVVLLSAEGLLVVASIERQHPGQSFSVKQLILEADPVDMELCVVLAHPGTDAFAIQFNSAAERTKWVAAFQACGTSGKSTPTSSAMSRLRVKSMAIRSSVTSGGQH
ncbi:hypothetical protein H9P43_008476 [Blastocladiella emersonii ATCC 22665]|nr:hypothetical protein H9P43_008476 [Blastocladiella emersonii ATCC 22665]